MLLLLLFTIVVKSVSCANILFVTVLPSPSHHIWNEALVEGLLAHGHNITMIGYEETKIKSKNYTVLKLEDIEFSEDEMKLLSIKSTNFEELLATWEYTVMLASDHYKSNALKILLDYPRDSFDLIVYDVSNSQALYPLMKYFGNPPVIGVSPFGIPPYIADTVGHHFYSYFPIYFLPYTDDMTFLQRLENAYTYFIAYCLKLYYTPILFKLAKEKFGEDIVPIEEAEGQIALLLANHDPILDYPQPLPPQIIPVGGLNIKPARKLPEDYLDVLDKAKHGVIYFSLGTNINPEWFSKEQKQMFLKTFARLKEIVLWKYGGDDLEDVPKNVVIRKWFPQNDILGHKNVKLFITHNGALSTHEAMYHGTPLLGIPFIMDQIINAAKTEGKVIGKKVDFFSLTEDVLYDLIQEILQNPVYKRNIQKLSSQFRDSLATPLERAVFWVEYILKHKDIKNLSTKGRYMNIFAREHLDIIAFVVATLLLWGYLLVVILGLIIRRYCVKKGNKIKQS